MEPFVQGEETHMLLLPQWMKQYKQLTAGFTTRKGGVSKAPFHSFNIGLHVQDEPDDVLANRKKLAESVGMSFEAWTSGEQIHGNQIAIVTSKERGRGRASMQDAIIGVDGLVTNEKDVLLTSFYADCVPLYFWDAEHHVIGLAHAGWKGTVTAIAREMIEVMSQHYGTKPEQLQCAIGPSIGACCYEVNHVVIDRVVGLWEELELPEVILESVFLNKREGKAHINLKEINRQIMIKAGILPSHIEISERCTGCQHDLFYSHRMENGKTGRMASWIGIRKG
ncbi:peptidoglycan editing factor PgeF [Paenibacillus septentrionalis]|uniref:Purine nucleoside phosphorylase n=1 Tax=Paenibacillus septentrionalis TaxID=429342 RepID=A0ABW1V0J0_9BACL